MRGYAKGHAVRLFDHHRLNEISPLNFKEVFSRTVHAYLALVHSSHRKHKALGKPQAKLSTDVRHLIDIGDSATVHPLKELCRAKLRRVELPRENVNQLGVTIIKEILIWSRHNTPL